MSDSTLLSYDSRIVCDPAKLGVILSLDYKFTSVTDQIAKLCGYNNGEHMQGTTPFNIRSKAVECMPEFYAQDRQIIDGKRSLTIFNLNVYSGNELKCLITKKDPVFDKDGHLIGLVGNSQELDESQLESFAKRIYHHALKHNKGSTYQLSYTIVDAYSEHGLTAVESNVLYLLSHGKSGRQIADTLYRSQRTIEAHINNIKFKLQISSKAALIEFAIFSGLLTQIPKGLVSRLL
jgi:DNA-binding CsgD family transcriptional regulator